MQRGLALADGDVEVAGMSEWERFAARACHEWQCLPDQINRTVGETFKEWNEIMKGGVMLSVRAAWDRNQWLKDLEANGPSFRTTET